MKEAEFRARFEAMQNYERRAKFEAWISNSPYNESVARFPDDPSRYGWPGSYKDVRVDMCWQAWQEALRSSE